MFSFACYLMDITGSKSYNINVSFHININPPRTAQRRTGVCKLFPFIFGVGNSLHICSCFYRENKAKTIQMLGLFVLSIKTATYVQTVYMIFPTPKMKGNNLHTPVRSCAGLGELMLMWMETFIL